MLFDGDNASGSETRVPKIIFLISFLHYNNFITNGAKIL